MKYTTPFALLFFVLGIAFAAVDPAAQGMFNKLDADGDGRITMQEFKAKPEVVKETHMHGYGCFELADVNNDGALDVAEFDAYEEEIPCE